MMKTSDDKTLHDAEVEALLAAMDLSVPERRAEGRMESAEGLTVASAWEIDIHDSSVTELNR